MGEPGDVGSSKGPLVDIAAKLRKKGFTVQAFDTWHHRVNGEFDFWLNRRMYRLSWKDRVTGDVGEQYSPQQMFDFIVQRLSNPRPEVTKEVFIQRLVEIGWKKEEAEKEWTDKQ
jgi:hypothetical protein